MKKYPIFKFSLYFTCLFAVLCFAFGAADAQTRGEWKKFSSETELFKLLMPGKVNEKSTSMRVDESRILYSSEAIGFIDQRPYKNVVKNYIVSIDQTLGPALTDQVRTNLINRDLDFYTAQYKELGGIVKDRKLIIHASEHAGEIYITYDDPEFGLQGLRAIVAMSNSNRVRQVVTGANDIMFSHETNNFFNSLKFQKGLILEEGSINEDWNRLESPFKLFSMKVPPVTPPYFLNEPHVQSSDKRELVSAVFTDPLWGQQIFYNVYGYRFDKEIGFAEAQTVLLEKHIKKHRGPSHGVRPNKSFLNKTPFLSAEYQIKGPKGYPYINTVKLRGLFLGNYMMVQEVMSSDFMVQSAFTQGIFDLIEFTPKKANKHYVTKSFKDKFKKNPQ